MIISRERRKNILQNKLGNVGLYFKEMDSRMNYGLIGNICKGTDIVINVFPSVFYVVDPMFPISKDLFKEIKYIQKHFKELR